MIIQPCPACGYFRLVYLQREHKFNCPRCKQNFYGLQESKAHKDGKFPLFSEGTLSSYHEWEKAPWE